MIGVGRGQRRAPLGLAELDADRVASGRGLRCWRRSRSSWSARSAVRESRLDRDRSLTAGSSCSRSPKARTRVTCASGTIACVRLPAHFRIPDAKTEAGIREVQASPDLVAELVARLDLLQRAGHPIDATAYLFQSPTGPDESSARGRDRWRSGVGRLGAARRSRPSCGAEHHARHLCAGPTSRSRCLPTASGSCGR